MTLTSLFIHLFNMSITATWIALAVMALRLVLKRTRVPKALLCVLWVLVAARLLLPFSVESALSLVPSKETVPPTILIDDTPAIQSGIPVVNHTLNPIIKENLSPVPWESVNPMQVVWTVASWIWIGGMILMALYAAVSYLRLRRRVRVSVETEPKVMICDGIDTPFILGILRPRIYLPSALSDSAAVSVLSHERAHLARRDHLWKPLGFLVLTVYWFNPILWVAYALLCRDIELACDERVVKTMTAAEKKDYSEALLACSLPHRAISACPLAFGEVGVKERVKSVLHYKKPLVWVIAVALIASVAVGVFFLTDPIPEPKVSVWTLTDESFERESITEYRMTSGFLIPNGSYNSEDPQAIESLLTALDELSLGEPLGTEEFVTYDADYSIRLVTASSDGYYLQFNHELSRIKVAKNPIQYTAEGIMRPLDEKIICTVYAVYDTDALEEFIKDVFGITSLAFHPIFGELSDGTVTDREKENVCFSADLDGNGITEKYRLGHGPFSGRFSITITGLEEENPCYYRHYFTIHGDFSFTKHEDGHIMLRILDYSDGHETLYDLVNIGGDILLKPVGEGNNYGEMSGSFISSSGGRRFAGFGTMEPAETS